MMKTIKEQPVHLMLPLSMLENNKGQLEGLPANPRNIHKNRYEQLLNNIKEHPEMLRYRELMVFPIKSEKYIVIGGNMRLQALKELKYKEAPCVVINHETSISKLRAFTILDNNEFGKWDWDMLANEWQMEELTKWGIENYSMLTDEQIDDFFETAEESNHSKNICIKIELPENLKEQEEDIKKEIKRILKNFPGAKIL